MQNDVSRSVGAPDCVGPVAEAMRAAVHAGLDDPGANPARVGELCRAISDRMLVVHRLPELIRRRPAPRPAVFDATASGRASPIFDVHRLIGALKVPVGER